MINAEQLTEIENDDAWDTGEMGRDENHVRAAKMTPDIQAEIDDAMELQMISIRLPKSLIEDFKFLGEVNGIRYQTLIRQSLVRFAEGEKKHINKKAVSEQTKSARKVA
jgi:predicted DNA binding CopG/RHH family protein